MTIIMHRMAARVVCKQQLTLQEKKNAVYIIIMFSTPDGKNQKPANPAVQSHVRIHKADIIAMVVAGPSHTGTRQRD